VFHNHKRHSIKLVLVVGGNSTTQLASSLFPDMVPPMVGFQVGLKDVRDDFKSVLKTVFQSSEVETVQQTRLQCKFQMSKSPLAAKKHMALSEVTLHRGNYPKVISHPFN